MMPVSRALGHEIAAIAWMILAHHASGRVVLALGAFGVCHFLQSIYYTWKDNENRS